MALPLVMVITPPAMVNAYVTNHPLTTVYLNGEAVEGIGLPANLAFAAIPVAGDQYAYVNRVPCWWGRRRAQSPTSIADARHKSRAASDCCRRPNLKAGSLAGGGA